MALVGGEGPGNGSSEIGTTNKIIHSNIRRRRIASKEEGVAISNNRRSMVVVEEGATIHITNSLRIISSSIVLRPVNISDRGEGRVLRLRSRLAGTSSSNMVNGAVEADIIRMLVVALRRQMVRRFRTIGLG